MKRAEPRSYIRQTGIDDVRKLLKSLKELSQLPIEAIRMVDREISGLLAHPKSPFYHAYRIHAFLLFPAGLESTAPGRDIILVLNDSKGTITKRGKEEHIIEIPSLLKNPEKGVAQIIGLTDARRLFEVRGEILSLLIQTEPAWQKNIIANNKAKDLLKHYAFYPDFYPEFCDNRSVTTETCSFVARSNGDATQVELSEIAITKGGKEDIPSKLTSTEKLGAQIIQLSDTRKLIEEQSGMLPELKQKDATCQDGVIKQDKANDSAENQHFSPRFFDKRSVRTATVISVERSIDHSTRVEPSDTCSICVIS